MTEPEDQLTLLEVCDDAAHDDPSAEAALVELLGLLDQPRRPEVVVATGGLL